MNLAFLTEICCVAAHFTREHVRDLKASGRLNEGLKRDEIEKRGSAVWTLELEFLQS